MKLMNTSSDQLGVDARTKSTPRPPADNSSNDNGSPPFEGVLSDVKSDPKSAVTKDTPVKKAPDASVVIPAATDLANGANSIIDALQGLLAKGAATPTDAKADTKATTSDTAGGDDAVDSLLKKMAGKDDTATDAPANGAAQAAGTPTDMMSILLLGAGAPPALPASSAAPAAAGTATTAEAAALVSANPTANSTAKSATADAPTTADDKEMSVTDIAVSTHLPPAQAAQNNAFLANDVKTAAKTANLTSGTTVAGSAHAHPDDLSIAGKGAEPSTSATSLSATNMGLDFGPVHSIANAITELAAPAAPAAAIPEAPKPAIGIARTMTLQMNPADLGTVDIRLHITGQALDVQLTVSDTQTLGIINRDRETLTSALHGQNYAVNSLVIQDGGAAASSGGNNNGNQGDTSGSNARADRQGSGTGGDSQGGGGRQGSGAERPTQDERRSRSDAPSRLPAETRSGSLYV